MSWKYRRDEPNFYIGDGLDLSIAGGLRPAASLIHAGNSPAIVAADGVDSTPVATEVYVSSIFIPFTILATGIAIFNGSVVATDKVRVGIYDGMGVLKCSSAVAGFQPTTTDAYEKVPFALGADGITAQTTMVLPTGTYYIGCIYNGTTNRFNAFGIGAFPTIRVTSAVFATAFVTTQTTLTTLPTVFTATDKPPICSLY